MYNIDKLIAGLHKRFAVWAEFVKFERVRSEIGQSEIIVHAYVLFLSSLVRGYQKYSAFKSG